MTPSQHRRSGRLLTGAAVLLLVGGATTVAFALQPAPAAPPPGSEGIIAPTAVAAPPRPTVPSTPRAVSTPTPSPTAAALTLARSEPTRLEIPAIGVDTRLMQLGLKSDRTIEVPPYDKNAPAGWYRGSPTPGQIGPSVILGHVDTFKAGPVVFYRLSQMKPGNTVTVHRKDGSAARFVVDRVINVPKADFPTLEVYGNTDRAELRLITCGGDFDRRTGHYVDNVVAFAHLVA
jgi:hypothetical protein